MSVYEDIEGESGPCVVGQGARPKRRAPNAAPQEQDEFLMQLARRGVKAREAVEEFMAVFLPFTEEGAAERKRVKSLYQHRLRRARAESGLHVAGPNVEGSDESTSVGVITTGDDLTAEAGAGTTISVNDQPAGSRAPVQPGDEVLVQPPFTQGALAPDCEHSYTLEWGVHADEMRRAESAYARRNGGIAVPDELPWDDRVRALVGERERAVTDAFSRGQTAALEGVRDALGFSCEAAEVVSEARYVIETAREHEAGMRRQRDEAIRSHDALRMRYQPGDWELVFTGGGPDKAAPGRGRISVIKAIREATGLGLKESKDACDAGWDGHVPQVLLRGLSEASARTLASGLQAAGALCEVRRSPSGKAVPADFYDLMASVAQPGERWVDAVRRLQAAAATPAAGDAGTARELASVAQSLSVLAALAPQQQDLIVQRDARIEALEAHIEDLRRQAGLK